MNNEIGTVRWTDADMRAAYPEFQEIYKRRPLPDNDGGMKSPHAFLAWFMLRQCNPKLIVESGVWRGQGTWLLEQACPDADFICLDIDFSNLAYKAANAEYIQQDFDVVDFSSWDLGSALCFFDDHQNAFARLQQMHWKGFRSAIFEDNYPPDIGDCYSLKKVFAGSGDTPVRPHSPWWHRKKTPPIRAAVPANSAHRDSLLKRLETYYEGPPLVEMEKTRWGADWYDPAYATKPALFARDEVDETTLREGTAFTWMCYVEIRAD